MTEFSGTLTIDGQEVKWDRMSARGLAVRINGIHSIHLDGEPNEDRIRLAVACWSQGYSDGKHAGRRILQNEFRNLMDFIHR